MKPKIAITLDWQEKGTFSSRRHYALREHYFDYIHAIGGIPVAMPYIGNLLNDYIDNVDAVIIPGGGFSSPDDWYLNDESTSPYEPSPRLDFDLALTQKCLDSNIPLLGICAGMQIMAGIAGCKMTADVHKYFDTDIDHINGAPAEEFAHDVNVVKDTLLQKIVGVDNFSVNSAHREAVISTHEGSSCIVNSIAPDGVIEGVEFTDKRFAIGVQWHPEFFLDENNPSFKIGKALVKEAQKTL